MTNDAQTAEIPALGEGYSHARKAYGFVSALLMAWELIGVELEASPIESLKLTLKSPQAAPYVLIVLILYFGFRMIIEWYQNDLRRRRLRASRIDFVVAHFIAGAAVLLYAFQTLSKIQVADKITLNLFAPFVIGIMLGQSLHMLRARWRTHSPSQFFLNGLIIVMSIGFIVWSTFISAKGGLTVPLVGAGLGLSLGLTIDMWMDWFIGRLTKAFQKK